MTECIESSLIAKSPDDVPRISCSLNARSLNPNVQLPIECENVSIAFLFIEHRIAGYFMDIAILV